MYDPFTRGSAPVGVRTIELGRGHVGGVFTSEVWYPAAEKHRGQDLDDATRDKFSIAPGLPDASQQALRDAEPIRGPLPLVMYWHGGYGHRREASNICTHLASHGYVVAAPDFPGDNIKDTLAPPEGDTAKVATTPIDESARNRPRQAVAAVDAFPAAARRLGLDVQAVLVGSCGISMGGFTSLAVNSIDPRFVASFAMCPMYGTSGPLPQIHRLQGLLHVDDWQRPVHTFVLAGELDALIPLPDLRELYRKLPVPKRLAVLKRAGHIHFGDNCEAGHERYRAAYLSGAFPDPEIDAIALGTAMRPFAELCSEADALATARSLCLAQMDAAIKQCDDARAFLDGDIEKTFAARGIDLENAAEPLDGPARRGLAEEEWTMAKEEPKLTGPDLAAGISAAELGDGSKLVGHAGGEEVLLVRRGTELFAVGAQCTHYHGPLVEGLIVDATVRCPWHHACFDLQTGEALRAPALTPLARWSVEEHDGKIFVRDKLPQPKPQRRAAGEREKPEKIVIVGGGAAGFAAAERLRREGYARSIVMLSEDDAPPVDRPNLSKDYLAGTAPEEWVPLRPERFYSKNGIDLRLKAKVTGIDVQSREVILDGNRLPYDRLLLATGAAPVRLSIPGAELPHVRTLRSLADSRAIIERAGAARRAVVMGASFIGLEVAAALRTRNLEVHVVAPEKRPMEKVLGPQLGDFVRALHEEHGVIFHLEEKASVIEERRVRLESGGAIEADLVVAGIGVRPRTELAERAGAAIEHGVLVNEYLETSIPGIFAAGDIARWPDPHTGEKIRVEHWVVAERQGQTAALNLLGRREKFTAVPFFWSQHYDVAINYVGHAAKWDELAIDGDIAAKDCLVRFNRGGRTLAVASIFRDVENLQAEVAMERGVAPR